MTTESPIKKTRTVIIVMISITIFYMIYRAYKYLNYENRLMQLIPYDKSLNWVKVPECSYDEKIKDTILADFFVCSSSNTPFVSNLKYDYLDVEVIKKTLMAGARYIELTITANDLTEHPSPVVSKEINTDQLSTTFNTLELADVCYTVNKFGFQSYYDNENQLSENNYPLFVYLNVLTDNVNLLNDITSTIKNIWKNRLLDDTYNHSINDLAHVNMCKLFGKIIIMTDSGDRFQTSQFDSIINYSKLIRLHHNQISSYNLIERAKIEGYDVSQEDIIKDPNTIDLTKLGISTNEMGKYIIESKDYLTETSKQNLIVVYPNTKDDITMVNHDFSTVFGYGCNFIAMNFQVYDKYLEKYIEIFKERPFILKNKSLRLERTQIKTIIPPIIIPSPLLENIITGAEYTFNNIGVSILPFYQEGIHMKYSQHSRRLIVSKMPQSTPNDRFNKLGLSEENLYGIVPGLAKLNKSISFKSVKFPGRYLQIVEDTIQLLPNTKTEKFKKNSSFMLIDAGQEKGQEYYRIISAFDKEKYIRVINEQLMMDKYNGEQMFNAETKFSLGIAKISKYRSFKTNSGKYLRILDGGFLTSNITHIDTSAKFKLYKLDDEHYGIVASNNNFLEYNGVDKISATSPELKGTYTSLRIVKEGNLYKITTAFDPKLKTLYITGNGGVKVSYDGNILGPKITAPTLPSTKFFSLVETYGIETQEKQI
jgi:hypothetical protein